MTISLALLQQNDLQEPFSSIKQKAIEAEKRLAQKSELKDATPSFMFLPGMRDFMRAMPNHLARSSIYAPVASGKKKLHKGTIMISRGDAVIKFWGEQLDEAQADVWMQAMYEAVKSPLGTPVVIERSSFLRSIGRQIGGDEYRWLHRTMHALAFAMLVIEVTKDGKSKLAIGKTRALHMIDSFDYDDDAKAYTLRIDPRWREMYGNKEFALIDWQKRLMFGQGQHMAKSLQRLVATSNEQVHRYDLGWLKEKLGYTGRIRDFSKALEKAMRELERLEIIAGGHIGTSTKGKLQTVWTRL
jgi:hypothetical protein